MNPSIWFTLIFFGLLAHKSFADESELDWLAYGDLRGNIETCGCDPRTDLGGISRLGGLVENEKKRFKKLIVFDLGNNIDRPYDSIKSNFIMQGLNLINPDARLANVRELESFSENQKLHSKLDNFLLSNKSDQVPELRKIAKSLKINHSIVFGYTWHERLRSRLQEWGPELKKSLQMEIGTKLFKNKVLLFSGPDHHLKRIASSGLFDLIISSNTSQNDTAGFVEKENPNLLLRVSSPRFVRMVPLGGVGLLRGGSLLDDHNDLENIFKISNNSPLSSIDSKSGSLTRIKAVTWLNPTISGSAAIDEIMIKYNIKTAEEFKKIAHLKSLSHLPSNFVGANTCQTCHTKEYAIWKNSKHEGAYRTLEAAAKHSDESCIGCHVVGYNAPGGFSSIDHSPHLAGVQCESCHGGRKEHITNPTKASASRKESARLAKSSCETCHHIPHSSSFSYQEYWTKIKHTGL